MGRERTSVRATARRSRPSIRRSSSSLDSAPYTVERKSRTRAFLRSLPRVFSLRSSYEIEMDQELQALLRESEGRIRIDKALEDSKPQVQEAMSLISEFLSVLSGSSGVPGELTPSKMEMGERLAKIEELVDSLPVYDEKLKGLAQAKDLRLRVIGLQTPDPDAPSTVEQSSLASESKPSLSRKFSFDAYFAYGPGRSTPSLASYARYGPPSINYAESIATLDSESPLESEVVSEIVVEVYYTDDPEDPSGEEEGDLTSDDERFDA
ncbi:hypothetical protein DFP72DRAFT_128817 [Ephemerocybe angulata]|uniref:Uncharacterized protein n=1 Tax=Ephemerocybe angulata TaxID=980116 RepID=A0A8H6LTM7_9AGAR|nr:hypothetical protein DFP72DRAFT_128817 [Tulosesus angulatus]